METVPQKLQIVEEEIAELRTKVDNMEKWIAAMGAPEELVERVAEKILANFYTNVGKTVTNKFFWLLGLGLVGLLSWLGLTGKLKNE